MCLSSLCPLQPTNTVLDSGAKELTLSKEILAYESILLKNKIHKRAYILRVQLSALSQSAHIHLSSAQIKKHHHQQPQQLSSCPLLVTTLPFKLSTILISHIMGKTDF